MTNIKERTMTKILSAEERVEKMMAEIDNLERITERGMWWVQMSRVNAITKNFANKLTDSYSQAIAEAEKKLLRTLLTECDRTENEGGRLLLTNYKLKVKK